MESFNGQFRDELLKTELFTTAPEAQILADRWRWEYNSLRPRPAPRGSSTGSCSMTTSTHSHKAWTDKGGRVSPLEVGRHWRLGSRSLVAALCNAMVVGLRWGQLPRCFRSFSSADRPLAQSEQARARFRIRNGRPFPIWTAKLLGLAGKHLFKGPWPGIQAKRAMRKNL